MNLSALLLPLLAAAADAPSRPAFERCAWERVSSQEMGLTAWVQRCDYGFRKIDLFARGPALWIRYSDGGEPEPLVEAHDLLAEESPEAGVARLAAKGAPAPIAARCAVVPWKDGPTPPGVRRFSFEPDPAFQKELDARATPGEVPEPPCGDLGVSYDGVQYWEAQPENGSRRVLFVRVGQDQPLFDEQTLRLEPGR